MVYFQFKNYVTFNTIWNQILMGEVKLRVRVMEMKSLTLDNATYHEYLEGKEVSCTADHLTNKSVKEGDHIMVYKDTLASNSDVPLPRREIQSDYIGTEGIVTSVRKNRTEHENTPETVNEVFIKKI